MIPGMRVMLIAPEPLSTDRAFLRIHNRASKDALREEALHHWKKRLPGHFKTTARGKYGYKARSDGYKSMKLRRFKSRTDLVKSGQTRDSMLGSEPLIRLGGKAANPDGTTGQLKLSMRMKFPFGASAQSSWAKRARLSKKAGHHIPPRVKSGVTIADMRKEIAKILPDESRQIAQGFKDRYTKKLNAELKNRPRIRKRLGL